MNTRRRKDSDHEERAAQPQTSGEIRDATLPCPQCRGEMHPMFLYEDREPDVWLCFACGHLEWLEPRPRRAIPPLDEWGPPPGSPHPLPAAGGGPGFHDA